MTALPRRQWTVEEYLAAERGSEIKHEFLDGDIYDMAGASRAHNTLLSNGHGSLYAQLRARDCDLFVADQRVRLSARAYVYPDLSVVCGEALFSVEAGLETLLNPTLIVEVLSPTTEQYDRGEKFLRYLQMDSLREYVMIAQDAPRVEVYTRQADGTWLYAITQGLDQTAALHSIDAALPLADLYRRVTFEADAPDG
ncbi:MAG: Uma2 family endonuclease [Anaerolineae bacterium]|nr:Uma2 family endonuclease [Anaerolineae bacterium]